MSICVNSCVCYQKNFVDILEHARQNEGLSLTDLQQEIEFGKKCGLCLPYVQRMLKTGETVFYQLISDDLLT